MKKWLAPIREKLRGMPPRLRKTIIGILGVSIVLFGIALIFLPGPSVIVIPLGLAVLATEFIWARRVLERGRVMVNKVRRRAQPAKNRVAEKDP